jgi:hypothetical protein
MILPVKFVIKRYNLAFEDTKRILTAIKGWFASRQA